MITPFGSALFGRKHPDQDMDSVNLWGFYAIGGDVRKLSAVLPTSTLAEIHSALVSAEVALNFLLYNESMVPLVECRGPGNQLYTIQIRVLIFKEADEWVAHALEMDLLGCGDSPKAAVEDLKKSVESQFSFAIQKRDDSLLQFPAEAEYFKRWEDAQNKALRSEILGDTSVKLNARAIVLSFSRSDLDALRKRRFTQAEPVCA